MIDDDIASASNPHCLFPLAVVVQWLLRYFITTTKSVIIALFR
jgi:hypothetical protein